MPAIATTLGQRCTVYLDAAGVQRFKIDSSIDAVLVGDLPIYGTSPYTSNIFVHQIVAANDPKADTFLRVANVVDLTTLPLGREIAVGHNQTLYVDPSFTVTYDNLVTATQAKTLIQQRVDNLIADWHKYNDEFQAPLNAPPSGPPYTYTDVTLPLTLSEETARKNAYYTAHSEYLAAQTATATAQGAFTAAAAAATVANDDATKAIADSQKCSNLLGQFNGANTAVSSYRGSVNTYMNAAATFATASQVYINLGASPGAGALATFTTAKGFYDAALVAMTAAVQAEALNGAPALVTFNTNMSQACTAKIADVQIAATNKTTADTAVATTTTAKRTADEVASAALIQDSLTFLSVKELCPAFEHLVP